MKCYKNQRYQKRRVLVASPSDVEAERAALKNVIERLNRGPADAARVVLEILEWRDVPPGMGTPEDVILNELPVSSWDIFIGILWLRFGQPTGNANEAGQGFESGTEEEFSRAYGAWKRHKRPYILMYRCTRVPTELGLIDFSQAQKVSSFFDNFKPNVGQHPGLYREFSDLREFETCVYDDLSKLIRKGASGTSGPVSTSAVQVGLVAGQHEARSAHELERAVLQALFEFRFGGVKCKVGELWHADLRLQLVASPVLRAWLRVRPDEMSRAIDRLQMLGFVKSISGPFRLPFVRYRASENSDRQSVSGELIVEKTDGSHVSIIHFFEKGMEVVIAIAGVLEEAKFKVQDPCPFTIDARPLGRMLWYSLTKAGLQRLET